jgi:hypothetical protein
MKTPSVGLLIWFALSLGACGYRENGESCWSDDECVSSYCSWGGECEPGLLEWIASLFVSEPQAPPFPRSAPSAPVVYMPPPPSCNGKNEEQCLTMPYCTWTAICLDLTPDESTDAGVFACTRDYELTRTCPEGCAFFASCY